MLGDRLRMQTHAQDAGVFIRSMATRGHLGGLARATADAALVLDAAGKDVIIIETVGVGQDEVDIIRTADVSVVTLVPGTGDEVQALKAGIMEIPDVIVVNKRDHPLAEAMQADVRQALSLGPAAPWQPPVLMTEALRGDGIAELWDAVGAHRAHLESAGLLEERRRRNLAAEVFAVASARARRHLEASVAADPELRALLERVERRELDPLSAVHEILRTVFGVIPERD